MLETESSKGFGGQEKRTVRLCHALDKSKVKVYFAANPDSYLFKEREALGIECFGVKMRATYDLLAIKELYRIIKEQDIDIVSTHSGRDGWLGGLAAKFAGVKCIRVRHLQTPFKNAVSYKYLADEVTAVSAEVESYVASKGVEEHKIRVVYTGIDTERFKKGESSFRREIGVSGETFLIGSIAVLRAAKRHVDLIDAVFELSKKYDVKLAIVGDGPQRENLEAKIQNEGLAGIVIMTGHRNDTVNILSSLDLFVLASKMEALGTAILEAESCGVPVVGSRVGGIPEALEDGRSGLLFESGDTEDLIRKIERFIVDTEFRQQASVRARELVKERFSTQKMAEETLRQYMEILS